MNAKQTDFHTKNWRATSGSSHPDDPAPMVVNETPALDERASQGSSLLVLLEASWFISTPKNQARCGDCKTKLQGLPALQPKKLMPLSKPQKTVSSAYGGSRCAHCVREKIVRAFRPYRGAEGRCVSAQGTARKENRL